MRNLIGVRRVTNLITLVSRVPKTSSGEVKARIEQAMERDAQLDARRINVEVRDGKVILSGTVRARIEREEAENAARAAPGVTDVEDHITIAA